MKIFSLLIAVSGNLYLCGLFGIALLSPEGRTDFIFRIGMLFFVIEFLSIHSSGMIEGQRLAGSTGKRQRLSYLIVLSYLMFAVVFAMIFHNWNVPLMFMVSVLAKFFGRRASPGQMTTTAISVILFLGTVFLTIPTASWLSRIFPFSTEIMSRRVPGTSGLFVSYPQTLLAWGILYYSLSAVAEIVLFCRHIGTATPSGSTGGLGKGSEHVTNKG